MYFPSSQSCNLPNSATPLPAAAIAAQDARVSRRGVSFDAGNAVLNSLMGGLTPPVARPSCGDLQNSLGLFARSPFPEPGGGPAPTVETFSNPAAIAAWLANWAKSAAAAEAYANDGAIAMPTIGGPISGVSSPVSTPAAAGGEPGGVGVSGLGGYLPRRSGYGGVGYGARSGRFRRLGGVSGLGVACEVNPDVLPVETVFPVNPAAAPGGGAGSGAGSSATSGGSSLFWLLAFLAAGAIALSGDDSNKRNTKRKR